MCNQSDNISDNWLMRNALELYSIFTYVLVDAFSSFIGCEKRVIKDCDEVRDLLLQCTSIPEAIMKSSIVFPDLSKDIVNDFMAWKIDDVRILDNDQEVVPSLRLHNIDLDFFKDSRKCRANRAMFMHFAGIECRARLNELMHAMGHLVDFMNRRP